jgi:hypothetical protein
MTAPVITATASASETDTGFLRRRRLGGDLVRAFGVAAGWQLLLTLVGALFERSLGIFQVGPWSPPQPFNLLTHTYRWDSAWYAAILHNGYALVAQAPAFYPVFSALTWLVETISFGAMDFIVAGFFVNLIATWLAVLTLVKIARHFVRGERAAWLVVAALLTSTCAFFMHVLYTEATFLCLGLAAYLFALRRRWWLMGLALVPLTATRLPALLFVALCFLEYCRSKRWTIREILGDWSLLWFPVGLLGFVGYAAALRVLTGNALAMFAAYQVNQDWSGKGFAPDIFPTLGHEITLDWDALTGRLPLDHLFLVDHLLPMGALIALVTASIYVLVALRGDGVPLGGFGLLAFWMYTAQGSLVSAHRYVLPCLVIYLALALAAQRHRAFRPVMVGFLYAGGLSQGVLYLMFVSGVWAG